MKGTVTLQDQQLYRKCQDAQKQMQMVTNTETEKVNKLDII